MKQHLLEKIVALTIFVKASFFKKGSLLLLSTPLSIGVFEMLRKLVENVDYKDIALPIVSVSICISIYFLFFTVDLLMGLIASKYEANNNPDWIKYEKLYTSLGKIGGVLLIDIIFLTINLFLVVLDFSGTAKVFTTLMVSINVLASLYEFHSIGENIKRRTNIKPKIFKFFDSLTTILESKIMDKIISTIDEKEGYYPDSEE